MIHNSTKYYIITAPRSWRGSLPKPCWQYRHNCLLCINKASVKIQFIPFDWIRLKLTQFFFFFSFSPTYKPKDQNSKEAKTAKKLAQGGEIIKHLTAFILKLIFVLNFYSCFSFFYTYIYTNWQIHWNFKGFWDLFYFEYLIQNIWFFVV